MQDNPDRQYVDTTAAATEILGGLFTAATLRTWRSRGGGPPFRRIGRRKVRYDVAELREWMQGRRIEPKESDAR